MTTTIKKSQATVKFITLITLALASICHGQTSSESEKLDITFDTTWVSKYIWRGYDIFDDHATIQPSLDIVLPVKGFSLNIFAALPASSGYENFTEADYTLSYSTTFLSEDTSQIDMTVNYIYYDFYKVNSKAVPDTEEIGMSIELPNLLTINESALVPSYYIGFLWPHDSNIGIDIAGSYHTFALSYDLRVCQDQVLSLSADINYNGGMFGAEHDFSHSTLGVSTSIELGDFSISPFLKYQIPIHDMFDTFNEELYGGLSITCAF